MRKFWWINRELKLDEQITGYMQTREWNRGMNSCREVGEWTRRMKSENEVENGNRRTNAQSEVEKIFTEPENGKENKVENKGVSEREDDIREPLNKSAGIKCQPFATRHSPTLIRKSFSSWLDWFSSSEGCNSQGPFAGFAWNELVGCSFSRKHSQN